MSVDWNGYEPYVPPHYGPLHEMPRSQARECYKHLMAAKPERIEQLRKLLDANGVRLDSSDAGIQALNDWLRENVEPSMDNPERLHNLWYAVVNDVGLFLGDILISRYSGLRWEMFTAGRKNVAYHKHVIVGFAHVPNPRYNIDIDRLVATFAYRVVKGLPEASDYFLTVIRAAATRA